MTAPVTAPELGVAEVENPAAFPCTGEGFNSPHYTQHGMTLRDWFAGQALAGAVSGMSGVDEDDLPAFREEASNLARFMYETADAMLVARSAAEAARSGGEG